MTENQAIKILQEEKSWESDDRKIDAFIMAIDALKEIQQYRAIGTPEECRAAVEKQKKVKPTIINNGIMLNFKCPRCGIERLVGRNAREDYCGECGQLWDWSDEE